MGSIKEWIALSALASTACILGACGGSDDEEEEPAASAGGSYDAIAGAIESPTGTIDASTAADVARAFEESIGTGTSGGRDGAPAVAQDVSVDCPDSGTVDTTVGSSGSSEIMYNDCCTAGCCINGSADSFVDTSGTAAYTVCVDYNASTTCDGLSIDYTYSYCAGADGSFIYAVEVDGDTFAVSGSVANGNGQLTVTGENGSYTCDYTDYSGTCTSDSGDSFTF